MSDPHVSTKKEGEATQTEEKGTMKDDEPFEWLDGNNHLVDSDPYDMRDDGSPVKKKGGKTLSDSVSFSDRVEMFS